MGISALELLSVVESADRVGDLEGWARAFGEGTRRALDARACQLLRVRDGGSRIEALGLEDPLARSALAAGHAGLGPEQRRRVYQSGATALTLDDLYDASAAPPEGLMRAMREADMADVIGLVAPAEISIGIFTASRQRLDARRRQLLLSLAQHAAVSVALRHAMEERAQEDELPARLRGELPARLRGALDELERRRTWARRHGDADDAAKALSFLGALAGQGFAVVHESRSGRRHRLVAVRVKDPSARAMRMLDAGERDVLDGLSRGRSIQEIAFDLGIAEATVSGRIARIRTKLGIDPRCEIVRVAGTGERRD